jgi:hypothetical protein
MPGSIMIRPVVGYPLKVTAVNDTYYSHKKNINIWPNPAKDYFYVDSGQEQLSGEIKITVLDLSGRELMQVQLNDKIDISSLHDGFYIIVTSLNGRAIGFSRLIKTR